MSKLIVWLLSWCWVLTGWLTSSVWAQSVSIQATRANALHGTNPDGVAYPGQTSYTGKDMILNMVDMDGTVSLSHPEFQGRVTNTTSATADSDHATKVASVAAATGVKPKVKGVAFEATIRAFDHKEYNKDYGYEAMLLANKPVKEQLISNHSYFTSDIIDPAFKFGTYDKFASYFDKLTYQYPYWLPVTASGNDDTGGKVNPNPHTTAIISGLTSYDRLVAGMQTAKNPLVVGAISFYSLTTNGLLSNAQLDKNSSFGPTDDLRVKPEVVSFGGEMDVATINKGYTKDGGTSLAAPAVAAGGLLLQQYYFAKFKRYMRAATLKALLLHTAERITPPQGYRRNDSYGPDPFGGYGLINLQSARLAIRNTWLTPSANPTSLLIESTLKEESENKVNIPTSAGQPVKVSLCWTDPQHAADLSVNSPISMLINDLELRVLEIPKVGSATVYYPYAYYRAYDGHIYSRATGANNADPYEFIRFEPQPGMTYKIVVSHTGSLTNKRQDYSLVVTGLGEDKEYNCEKTAIISNPLNVDLAIAAQKAVLLKSGAAVTNGTRVLFHVTESCLNDKAGQAREAAPEELSEPENEKDILLFPNPAPDVCRVVASEAINAITILTQAGQMISRHMVDGATDYQLDVSTLPTGLYLLRIESSSGKISTKRIVK